MLRAIDAAKKNDRSDAGKVADSCCGFLLPLGLPDCRHARQKFAHGSMRMWSLAASLVSWGSLSGVGTLRACWWTQHSLPLLTSGL